VSLLSFAAETKQELTQLEVQYDYSKYELAALIRMNGAVGILNRQLILNIQTENAAIARRIYVLLKKYYQVESELLVRRKMKLKKNNVYIVRLKHGTEEILEDLSIKSSGLFNMRVPENIREDEEKMRAYLRGAFLAGGSINDPKTSRYHLEIYSIYEEHNDDICQMMNAFGLNARTIERRKGYITYLKEAEKIADFLAVIHASKAMLHFEDIRIIRDMRNTANRLVNCENANINKVVNAATRQIEEIQYIEDTVGLDALPDKLSDIAKIRLENPEISLKELGEMLPSGAISKSGVNHRLRKISEFSQKLREEGKAN